LRSGAPASRATTEERFRRRKTLSRESSADALRRRRWVWVGVLALGLALSGCASGSDAQTLHPYQPGAGISNRDGQVYALNTLVVYDGKGTGTVVAALLNQRPHTDVLESVSVTSSSGARLQAQVPSGGITLPYRQSVQLGNSGDVRVSGKQLTPGLFVTLTFTFQRAAPVRIMVPVVDRGSMYKQVPTTPARS
jgi:hypothetical protein